MIREHGGDCCGVTHLLVFPILPNKEWLKAGINEALVGLEENYRENWEDDHYDEDTDTSEPFPEDFKFSHLIEAVLTDQQIILWKELMKAEGFRFVCRWKNHNSNNYCNMLLLETGAKNKERRPFKW